VRVPTRPALALGLCISSACSPGYVLRAGWEEARILARRRPIPEVIADPRTDPATRGKLELVLEAREYARRELGLEPGRSYRDYADVGRDTLALVLSAAPADSLVPVTWWFPIVGRVPYLGFFDAERARAEERALRARGYDTYLRPTTAFSTLGWLPDPLLSTALQGDSVAVVETVIHEVTHATIFVKGQVRFNESFANFVGLAGAAAFFCTRLPDGPLCREARARWHDAVLVSELFDTVEDSLRALYARGAPPERVRTERAALLERLQARAEAEVVPRLRSHLWTGLDLRRLNNASFLARRLYLDRLRTFDRWYRAEREDLAALLARWLPALRRADDPWAVLDGAAAAGLAEPAPDLTAAGR
jgi:predicted aminopeptidase